MDINFLVEIYDGRRLGSTKRDMGGSGYVVGGGLILTAHHVIGLAEEPVARGNGGYEVRAVGDFLGGSSRWLHAKVVWDDPKNDLALLQLDESVPPDSVIQSATQPLFARPDGTEQLPWSAIGFPLVSKRDTRNEALPVKGYFDERTGLKLGLIQLEVNAALVPRDLSKWGGMSGAPVFVAGYLVGVVVEASNLYEQSILSARRVWDLLAPDSTLSGMLVEHSGQAPQVWTISATKGNADATLPSPDRRLTDSTAELLDEHSGPLFGREHDLEAIDRYVTGSSKNPFVLRAPGGYGKTALLVAWLKRARIQGLPVAAHFFSWQHQTTAVLPALRSLLRQVRELRREVILGEETPRDIDAAHSTLYEVIKAPRPDGAQLVLVLDSLDEADQPFAPLFTQPLPEGLRVVLSIHGQEGVDPSWLSRWTARAETWLMQLLDRPSVRDWFEHIVQNASATVHDSEEVATEIWKRTEGYPLFLRYLLPDLVSRGSRITRKAVSDKIPFGFRDYVQNELRWLAEHREELRGTDQIITTLAVSPGPVPKSVLETATDLPALTLLGLPWQVERWLRQSSFGGEEPWYALSHRLVAAVVRSSVGVKSVQGARVALISATRDWNGPARDFALENLADLLGDAAESDDDAYKELLSLARSEPFERVLQERKPARPDLQLRALHRAISSTAARRDATLLGELVLRHAIGRSRLLKWTSPRTALRGEGDLEPRFNRSSWLADQRPHPYRSLWRLLLKIELRGQGVIEEDVQAFDLEQAGRLQLSPLVSALLWAAFRNQSERAATLARQLIPSADPTQVRLFYEGTKGAISWLVLRLVRARCWGDAESLAVALDGERSDLVYDIQQQRIQEDFAKGEWKTGFRRARRYLNRFGRALTTALGLALADKAERALRLLVYAKHLAEACADLKQRSTRMWDVAFAMMEAGFAEKAIDSANAIDDPEIRAHCFAALAFRAKDPLPFIGPSREAARILDLPPLTLAVSLARANLQSEAKAIIGMHRTVDVSKVEALRLDFLQHRLEINDIDGAAAILDTRVDIADGLSVARELVVTNAVVDAERLLDTWTVEQLVEFASHIERQGPVSVSFSTVLSRLAMVASEKENWERVADIAEQVLIRKDIPPSVSFSNIISGLATELVHHGRIKEARSVRTLGSVNEVDALVRIAEALVLEGCQNVEAELADELEGPLDDASIEAKRAFERHLLGIVLDERNDEEASFLRLLTESARDFRKTMMYLRKGIAIGLTRLGRYGEALNTAKQIAGFRPRDEALRTIGVYAAENGTTDIAKECIRLIADKRPSIEDPWGKEEIRVALAKRLIRDRQFGDAVELPSGEAPEVCARHYSSLARLTVNEEDVKVLLNHVIMDVRPQYLFVALPALALPLASIGEISLARKAIEDTFSWIQWLHSRGLSHIPMGDADAIKIWNQRNEALVELLISVEDKPELLDPNGQIRTFTRQACVSQIESQLQDFAFGPELVRRGAVDVVTRLLPDLSSEGRSRLILAIAEHCGGAKVYEFGRDWMQELTDDDYLRSVPLLLELADRGDWQHLEYLALRAAPTEGATERFVISLARLHPDAAMPLAKVGAELS